MSIGLTELTDAIGEWQFAMRAAASGSTGNRDVLANAIKNLPTPELEALRPHIAEAIKTAVKRTQKTVEAFDIVLDTTSPVRIQPSPSDAGSFFFEPDRKRG